MYKEEHDIDVSTEYYLVNIACLIFQFYTHHLKKPGKYIIFYERHLKTLLEKQK